MSMGTYAALDLDVKPAEKLLLLALDAEPGADKARLAMLTGLPPKHVTLAWNRLKRRRIIDGSRRMGAAAQGVMKAEI